MTSVSSSPQTVEFTGAGGITLVGDEWNRDAPSDRPSILMLHGGGQNRFSWKNTGQILADEGFHVVALDARGHGDSDWDPNGNYSLEAMSRDLLSIIATLRSPPALVGASMGGMCSLYSVGNSEAVIASALVLVDVVPRVGTEGAAKIGSFMGSRPEGFATLEEAADAVSAAGCLCLG